MVKQTVTVKGMMCPMCEKHVSEAVSSNFTVKSVSADRNAQCAVIEAEKALPEDKLRAVIEATGYEFGGVKTEEIKKKGFLGLF